MNLKRYIPSALCALCLLVFATGCGQDQSGVEWISMEKGLDAARREDKYMVVDFYTSWCKWCKVMEERTFNDQAVSEYLKSNFVCVRVNAEDRRSAFSYRGKSLSPAELAREFGVRGYPSLAYLESDGNLIMVVPGFIPPEKYIDVLKYFQEGHYRKDIDLGKFVSSRTG